MPQFRLIDQKIKTLWEYDPSSATEPPPGVSCTTALAGARAIARFPSHPIFYIQPGEVLVELENGRWTKLDGHAAATLIQEVGEDDDETES